MNGRNKFSLKLNNWLWNQINIRFKRCARSYHGTSTRK